MTSDPAGQNHQPHSADMLMEASRDHWWNADFLELMARRLRLDEGRQGLGPGCGRGHWTRAMSTVLPADAEILGIDQEAAWIADARETARRAGLDGRFR